jgi:GNAT superfamily N-acetyltransferase
MRSILKNQWRGRIRAMEFMTSFQWDEALWQKVSKIYHEAFGEHSPKPDKIIRNMFAKCICQLHVAFEDESVVAMALTGTNRLNLDSGILIIDYFAVEKDLRGSGIGREFFEYIKKWVISQKVFFRILLEVECENNFENHSRINFWKKCGFKLIDHYSHHYVWVPEPYQALVYNFQDATEFKLNGEEWFKNIADFHKESFRTK